MEREIVTLETGNLRLDFDCNSGSLVSVYSKVSAWYILNREELALSWRLMLPLKGRRNNNAWGHLQTRRPTLEHDNHKICFKWDHIESEFGGVHDICVTTVCENINDQAVFRMNIQNKSDAVVENVYYPYLGDLHRPLGCEKFQFLHGGYSGMKSHELYPQFPNPIGTHSVDFPTLTVSDNHSNPPMYPYGLAADENGNGLYIGIAERRIEAATWHAEAHPGWENSNDFRVFDEDEACKKAVFTRFAVGHLPFVMPGAEFDLLPFAMEAYRGDWYVGAACYTKVSRQWNRPWEESIPAWAKEPHSWLQVHINSPEDELRIPFTQLPELAAECQKAGVTAIQLVGWNDGGQDRGNPYHDPDPRLGTWEELKKAITCIQEMGIKLILFAKFVWADQSNDDFEEVFQPLSIKDPYGNYYVYKGYQYMTLTQLTNVNTRRLIPMCFGSETYLELCNREFMKCVDLGADGILFDECLHHEPTLCCFDTSHGHRYGESTYQFDQKLIDGFRKLLDGKEFLIAGEAVYDFQHDYYDVSYTRTWGREHKAVSRLMRPHGQIMSAVTGFNDRGMINQCLLNRYIISYEPYNFKGRLSDYPETVAYGQKMEQLRSDLRAYFWDGEFCAQAGAVVKDEDGKAFAAYAVYRSSEGTYGVVICNYESYEVKLRVQLGSEGKNPGHVRLVEQEQAAEAGEWLVIPPDSAAVVYE